MPVSCLIKVQSHLLQIARHAAYAPVCFAPMASSITSWICA